MKWSSSTLRDAADIQAQIERLNKALAELLQRDGTTVPVSNGRKNQATTAPTAPKPERGPGDPLESTVTITKPLNGAPSTLSAFEFLDEVLFWGNQFSGSEPKLTQNIPTYCLQGLKRVDSGHLLTQLEPL